MSTLCLPINSSAKRNDRPIIGILAPEPSSPIPNQTSRFIASHVKFLESAGARVVPIMINQSVEEYERLFNSINGSADQLLLTVPRNKHKLRGDRAFASVAPKQWNDLPLHIRQASSLVYFPGGCVSCTSSAFARSAKILYELTIEANKKGDYFPLWGTCLGLQILACLTSGEEIIKRTDTNGLLLPLTFTDDAKDSRMFSGFTDELIKELSSEPLSQHAHDWSLTLSDFNSNEKLKKFYKVLSTNTDGQVEFVSTIEAYDYPIYGIQWHPEKNAYEWTKPNISHTPSAVKTTFHMAEFFVGEARKNFHRFESEEEERKALIYNYSPVHTGPVSGFEQTYLFC